MEKENAPQAGEREARIDEVMVCRLLAQMSKMYPEEAAAAKRPDLRVVHAVKEPTQVELCECSSADYNPREFWRRHA